MKDISGYHFGSFNILDVSCTNADLQFFGSFHLNILHPPFPLNPSKLQKKLEM